MTVTEEGRHRLHQALDRTIGEEEATTLMEHLPPVGWADVATKQDLDHLQERIDHRFQLVDLRFDEERVHTDHRFDKVDERFGEVDRRFGEVDRRFSEVDARFSDLIMRFDSIDARLAGLENRLTHQFWQFLTVIVAFGAILIGVLRFT